MKITWFKVDDGFCVHPKVVGLDMAARGLWVTAGSWCAQQLTDGVIDDRQIRMLGGTRKQAEKLVLAGLWSHDGAAPSARRFFFEDWRDFQPTRDEVTAKRQQARERMAKARAKKAPTSKDAEMFARTNAERSQEVRSEGLGERSPYPDPTRPDPTITLTGNKHMSETSSDGQGKPKRFSYPAEFESWWRAYPRHRNASKKQALESWRKATKQIPPAELQLLTERYAATHGISDESKIPHPTTWLNQSRWETVDATDSPSLPRRQADGTRPEDWLQTSDPVSSHLQNLFGNPVDVIDAECWEEEPKEIDQ